jgi:transposase
VRLEATGIPTEIAERLGISESSVYRIVIRGSRADATQRHAPANS